MGKKGLVFQGTNEIVPEKLHPWGKIRRIVPKKTPGVTDVKMIGT